MKIFTKNRFFYISVNLAPGVYSYKYFVDNKWIVDLNAASFKDPVLGVDDNIIEVVPAVMEYSVRYEDMKQELEEIPLNFAKCEKTAVVVKLAIVMEGSLKIKGNWDNWADLIPMKKKFSQALNLYENYIYLLLDPGSYEYKYLVNNTDYRHDSSKLSRSDNFGGFNNFFKVLEKHNCNFGLNFEVEKLTWKKIDVEELNFSAIQGHSINVIGDDIYIFGGFYHGKFLDTLRCVSKDNLQIEQPYTTGRTPEPRAYHK